MKFYPSPWTDYVGVEFENVPTYCQYAGAIINNQKGEICFDADEQNGCFTVAELEEIVAYMKARKT